MRILLSTFSWAENLNSIWCRGWIKNDGDVSVNGTDLPMIGFNTMQVSCFCFFLNDNLFCSRAEVYLHGGVITSWKPADAITDLLFVRPDNDFSGHPKPIRFLWNSTFF